MAAARRMVSIVPPIEYRERLVGCCSSRVDELAEATRRTPVETYLGVEWPDLVRLQFEGYGRWRLRPHVEDVDDPVRGGLDLVRLRIYLLELYALHVLPVQPDSHLR